MGSIKDVLYNSVNPTLFLNVCFHRKQKSKTFSTCFEFGKCLISQKHSAILSGGLYQIWTNKHSYAQVLNHNLNIIFKFKLDSWSTIHSADCAFDRILLAVISFSFRGPL